mgnify:CR=1 FL=1
MEALFLWHVCFTLMMTGIIWFVQVVHYPLFLGVGADVFAAYEARHRALTFWVVAPLMLAELGSGLILLWLDGAPWTWLGAGLIGLNWASTFFIQVPLHARLDAGYQQKYIRRLVNSNWLRTAAWSARAGLLLWVMG